MGRCNCRPWGGVIVAQQTWNHRSLRGPRARQAHTCLMHGNRETSEGQRADGGAGHRPRSTKRAPGSGPGRRAHGPGAGRTASEATDRGTVQQSAEPSQGAATSGAYNRLNKAAAPGESTARIWTPACATFRTAFIAAASSCQCDVPGARPSAAGAPRAHHGLAAGLTVPPSLSGAALALGGRLQ